MNQKAKFILAIFIVLTVFISFNTVSAMDDEAGNNLTDSQTTTLSQQQYSDDAGEVSSSQTTQILSANDNDETLQASDKVIYVNPNAASGGDGSRERPYTNVKTAYNNIASGKSNEIVLMDGRYYAYSNGNINFNTNNLIIRADEGAHPILDFSYSTSSYNHWDFYGNNITLQGLNFISNSNPYSRFVYFYPSNSRISNCSFVNNWGTGGGVFLSNNRNVIIENSSFIHNYRTSDAGDAIYLTGTNNVTIKNNYIEGYQTKNRNSYGNAITVWTNVKTTKILNNTIKDVRAGYGPIFTWETSTDLLIDGNNFINCSSIGYAGVLYSMTENAVISNNKFINTSSGGNGGAIEIWARNNVLINNTFINSHSGNNGGAIYFVSGNYKFTMENSSFYNCTANGQGGAIYLDYRSYNYAVDIRNSNFTNCSSLDGGAIYSRGALLLTNGTFVNNSARNGAAIYNSRH